MPDSQTTVPAVSERSFTDHYQGLWVLIPVKNLSGAKQRLQARLETGRNEFTLAMFRDVLAALADSHSVDRVVVVTADSEVMALARQNKIHVVEEKGEEGMNAAISMGMAAIREMGGRRTAILHADIPLITGVEFDRIAGEFEHQVQMNKASCIGLAPSADRDGTNCLFLDAEFDFDFNYGSDSYRLHGESASRSNHSSISLYSPTISLDIDNPRDLDEFLSYCRQNPEFKQTNSWKYLDSRSLT